METKKTTNRLLSAETDNSHSGYARLAEGIIEKAIELLPESTYEPNEVGYFVKQDDIDMGNEDYCYKCIGKAIYKARKYHREGRNKILKKFEEIANTGFYNGINIKEKYPDVDLQKAKESELKEYPEKTKFTYEGRDPDFGGGQQEPLCCPECGDYFLTNFEPNVECSERLLEDLKDGDLGNKKFKETLKWKLEIALRNYKYCESDVQHILLQCAEIVIETYSSDAFC